MSDPSPTRLAAGSEAESLFHNAREIAFAAMALGQRVIRIRRGEDSEGRELLRRQAPLEPEWSQLVTPLREIDSLIGRVLIPCLDPIKQQLKVIGKRVNRCARGMRRGQENPLVELGPAFHDEGWTLSELLKQVEVADPATVAWAEDVPVPDDAEVCKQAAQALWQSDPVSAFERFRDQTIDALQLVNAIHQCAVDAPPNRPLTLVGQEFHDGMLRALREAQAFWFETPVARYLDRLEGPVPLARQGNDAGTVRGSCYHDLALRVASGLWQGILRAQIAQEFASQMRRYTAAGDEAAQHLASLGAEIRCESQQAIARWRAANSPSVPAPSVGNPPGKPATRIDKQIAGNRDDPPLSERQYDILEAMYLMKAYSCDSKQTTADIAERAQGIEVNPEGFKKAITNLKQRKLIETKEGRGGGCWLTKEGRQLIKQIRNL